MNRTTIAATGHALVELRMILLDLAREEDECAANEAAAQHYWEPCPASVPGHRAAAKALRTRADLLLIALRADAADLVRDIA